MKINCFLVDDNPAALEMLRMLLTAYPDLVILGWESDPFRAREYFRDHPGRIDLVFLDIEMPGLTGVDLAEEIGSRALKVFTTGYDKYGPEAVDNGVIGYLMKPVEGSKLGAVIGKARTIIEQRRNAAVKPMPAFRFIKGNGKSGRIRMITDDILYMEAYGSFSKFYLKDGRKVTSYHLLNDLEALFPSPHFIRIHRSFIVNVSKMERYTTTDVVMEDGMELPIGEKYRDALLDLNR